MVVEYKSSVNEMERFLGSHVFDDMIAVFEDWLEGAREKMEASDNVEEIWRCQGRIQVMKDVLLWPENFRDSLEEQQDDN